MSQRGPDSVFAKKNVLPPNLPPRGLSRVEAAGYVGISATKFDELVRTGLMPHPKRIGVRRIWDIHQLDLFFEALPSEDEHSDDVWDRVAM